MLMLCGPRETQVQALYKGGIGCLFQFVTQCESQLEASWTALKAWKSGYKSYLNKRKCLFQ
ncbi:hypothetical protein HanXRQr2_Chr10g0439941 [Helianthus annuus]|uniref:Uncharacterized protein n=1 Tax=Helianthus annuus TaxID=4232 RepID=A0A251TK29_HELAN|nr:hypothetical protein HanXRQr2_Chr10g0439941 [Helianthus annuus]